MAGLRFFVSSTCYDLSEERAQIRTLIQSLGHEPVLSEYNDILYDFNHHTHVSCVNEVVNADVVVLIIGSRFGGVAVEDTFSKINLDIIESKINKSKITELMNDLHKANEQEKSKPEKERVNYGLSVTHLEILKALEEDIPLYVFVQSKIWSFQELYSKNKAIVDQITFPGIEKPKLAKYLFQFIEILKNRRSGNFIFEFSNYKQIEDTLKNQLALKFKQLLTEEKTKKIHERQIDMLSRQFEELKIAMLESIESSDRREIAKGVIYYRRLIDFCNFLLDSNSMNLNFLTDDSLPAWESLLDVSGIKAVLTPDDKSDIWDILFQSDYFPSLDRAPFFFIKDIGFFEIRRGAQTIKNMIDMWDSFARLNQKTRLIIVDALKDSVLEMPRGMIRYRAIDFYSFVESVKNRDLNISMKKIIINYKDDNFFENWNDLDLPQKKDDESS